MKTGNLISLYKFLSPGSTCSCMWFRTTFGEKTPTLNLAGVIVYGRRPRLSRLHSSLDFVFFAGIWAWFAVMNAVAQQHLARSPCPKKSGKCPSLSSLSWHLQKPQVSFQRGRNCHHLIFVVACPPISPHPGTTESYRTAVTWPCQPACRSASTQRLLRLLKCLFLTKSAPNFLLLHLFRCKRMQPRVNSRPFLFSRWCLMAFQVQSGQRGQSQLAAAPWTQVTILLLLSKGKTSTPREAAPCNESKDILLCRWTSVRYKIPFAKTHLVHPHNLMRENSPFTRIIMFIFSWQSER